LENLSQKTVSVERGYALQQKLADEYPSINLLVTETTENALKFLASGKADAYIGNLMAGTYIIKSKGLNNIKIAGPAPFPDLNLTMGVRSDWPELVSIINKVLATLGHEEHVAIREKWLSPIRYEYGISINDILKWALGISSIAFSIIITILIWNKKLRKEISKRIKAEKEVIALKGIIPICSYCHNIRDDKGSWSRVEAYIARHSSAEFSHGICPICVKKIRVESELDEE